MKKLISITLCLVLVLALASSAFALSGAIGKLPIGGGGFEITTGESSLSAKGQEFYDMVEAIGDVTLEDEAAIIAAEEKYESLSIVAKNEYQGVKDAYATLQAARKALNQLKQQAATEATQAPTQAPTKPVIQIPTEAPTQAPTQAPTDTPVDDAGDSTFMVIAMVVLSMTALVVLVSKKKAF